MTYNPNIDSGYSKLKSWVQVPSGIFTSIEQSSEFDDAQYPERTGRNYAQLVYQIGTSSSSTTSTISVSEEYSRIVEVIGTDTYIAHAEAGSLSTESVWKVQKIDENGSKQWADGNTDFDNVATSPLSALTFTY